MGQILKRTSFAVLAGLLFSAFSQSFAADFPFSDVPASDPIRTDLQKLYDRGVVDAPIDGKFHPDSLMDRDEFVSIAVGVGCRKCLTPTVPDVLKYREIPFLDFEKKSPYFYCVSYAKEREIVFGYSIPGATSYACQDGKSWNGVPFCAKNRTSRIEAAAMLLRQAGLWDDVTNSANFERRRTFKDVDAYWYGYAQKGTDIGILAPDADGTLRPNEYVTKREFVKMAAIIYSLNMCDAKGMAGDGLGSASLSPSPSPSPSYSPSSTDTSAVASQIRILDSAPACSVSAKDAQPSGNPEYNFYWLPANPNATYVWEFTPADGSWSTVSGSGQCLSKTALPTGRWIVKLTVTTSEGKSTSYSEVAFGEKSLAVSASASPLTSPAGVNVNFSSVISWGKGPYSYRWDFGDGSVTNLSDPRHAYPSSDEFPVTLVVTDSEWSRAIARLVVSISENPDLDGDSIPNGDDSCPLVYGPASNKGCPPVSVYVSNSDSWTFWIWGASLSLEGIGGKCLYSYAAPKGAVFWKASCDSCPCAYDVDFLTEARRCDLLFPAILSKDKVNVFGRWAIYELR